MESVKVSEITFGSLKKPKVISETISHKAAYISNSILNVVIVSKLNT